MLKNYFSEQNLIILCAIIISIIPIVNIPFTWIMVFFHEISHALITLLTGGSVQKISIHITGSGICYSTGGIRFLILQAGYLGAIFWGVTIYSISNNIKQIYIRTIVLFVICLIIISFFIWSRDIITWIILFLLFSFFVSIIKLKRKRFIKIIIKFVGIYILLDAIKSPLHLIDGRHYGDGAKLADLTHIPEFIWIIAWLAIGVWSLVRLNRQNNINAKNTS